MVEKRVTVEYICENPNCGMSHSSEKAAELCERNHPTFKKRFGREFLQDGSFRVIDSKDRG